MPHRAGKRRLGFVGALSGLALLLAASRCPAEARVEWQTGFPLRAGPQVLLMWQPVPGAERYEVTRKDAATGREASWQTMTPQFSDSEALPEQTYDYVVAAILQGGMPGPRSEARRVAGVRPLLAPAGLNGLQEGVTVRLVWNAVEGAAFYNVYRSAAAGGSGLVASVPEARHVDATVKPGVGYSYRVRAVGPDARESPDSATLSIAVAAPATAGAGPEAVERRYVEVIRTIREGRQFRLREPTDLVFSAGALFVTNLGSRSILALDREGQFLYQFATAPPEYPGVWGIPWGIAVAADGGRFAVTFLRSPNVRLFSRDGKLVADLPILRPRGYEDQPEVPQPMDVVFDARQELWVTEYSYGQVVHLARDGREVGRVGAPRQAKDAGPFRSPTFIAADEATQNLYVVDSLRGAVFGLNHAGLASWIWERRGVPEGTMYLPKGVCVNGEGRVLVVDGLASSLQSFTSGGKIEAVYYSKNKPFLDLTGLVSAAVDPASGDIYALSKVDSTIYHLRVVGTAPGK